jgi:SulP family sulfate permease
MQKIRLIGKDIVGGVVGALITVPIILSCGAVYYQSLGAGFTSAGISAAFVSATLVAIVSGLFGSSPLHVNSPKTTHAAILSGMIATIAIHHSFSDIYSGDKAPVALMTICFLTLLVSGITQVLVGASRMGALVKFVPYPVLAGFINGFAIQIILTQAPKLIGLERSSQLLPALTGTVPLNWWCLGFATLAGGLVALTGRVTKLVPSAIVGLFGGTIAQITAEKFFAASELGPVIGSLPSGISFFLRVDDILQFVSTNAFSRHIFLIFATGITLAFVSSIQSLLSLSTSERLYDTRPNSNRELIVQGMGNVLAALFGGAPSGGSPNVTQSVFANGGHGGIANLTLAVVLLGLSYGLSSIISLIPLSVMAGVVVVTTVGSMDKWTQQLLVKIGSRTKSSTHSGLALNLTVVVLVAALVVLAGALAALGVGMATVFMVFLYRSNAKIIRRIVYADYFRSCTQRLQTEIDLLTLHGRKIALIEINGPIFFGSAETVARCVSRELSQCDWIVLDIKRVSHFDSSGVMMLKSLDDKAIKLNKRLFMSYLPKAGNERNFLQIIGLVRPEIESRIFEDTDSALSQAEDELLTKVNCFNDGQDKVMFEKFDILHNMTTDEIRILSSLMIQQQCSSGETIISKGEASHSLFFLVRGQVSVSSVMNDRKVRLSTFRAGTVFGEMGLFSSQSRTADVIAETKVILLELTFAAFDQISHQQPQLSLKLTRNLAAELSLRLNSANNRILTMEA